MTPNEFTYPVCGCGCSMTAKSNCDDCYYKSEHSEMGATWSVCNQYSDLSEATRACENSKECKLKITHKQVREAIDRQIPKRPHNIKTAPSNCYISYGDCPCCNANVFEYQHYCIDCGQKIDWGDKE